MPPKKKGATAKAKANAAATTPRAATRTSVPDTVTTSRGKEYETTAALSRPRRESAILQSPIELKKTANATPSKKRGRPAKQAEEVEDVEESETEEVQEPPKKRGRPATKKAAEPVAARKPLGRPPKNAAAPATKAAPKRLGRPPKNAAATPPAKASTKKRGRPSKADIAAENDEAEDDAEDTVEEDEPPKKRGPGRPAKKHGGPGRFTKKMADAVPKENTGPPKKRGSSPRGGETTKMDGDDDAAADQLEDELIDTAEQADSKASAVGGKGKGKGAKGKAKVEEEAIDDEELEQTTSERQYWLMKAEQEDREETLANGEVFNAKFTIDDLKSKDSPEPWDGVRNATAAKNMRGMKKGDLAFFYASGGKSGRKPGITGIMEIVKEHEHDATTADKGSYGYVEDEKARGKWCMVHVEYRNKLTKPVHLSELQKFMEGNGVLSKMQVLKQSRLSVTGVTEKEWNFITDNLIEGFEEEDALPGADVPNETSNDGFEKEDALPGAKGDVSNETPNGSEEDSTLIATDRIDGEIVINQSTRTEYELLTEAVSAGPVLATTESEIPSTDTIFPGETSQTSRPASRGGSRAPSIKAKATVSRQSSRASSVAAGSLAPPATNGRGRSRTPKIRAGSAAPTDTQQSHGAAGMPAIGEDDE